MSTDELVIRNLIAEWHRATAAGDVAAVLPLMAADVVFLVAGRPPMQGRDAFESGMRSILQTHRIESTGDIQEVHISGDMVGDADELHEFHRTNAVEIVAGPEDRSYGLRDYTARDVCGYYLNFGHRLPNAFCDD